MKRRASRPIPCQRASNMSSIRMSTLLFSSVALVAAVLLIYMQPGINCDPTSQPEALVNSSSSSGSAAITSTTSPQEVNPNSTTSNQPTTTTTTTSSTTAATSTLPTGPVQLSVSSKNETSLSAAEQASDYSQLPSVNNNEKREFLSYDRKHELTANQTVMAGPAAAEPAASTGAPMSSNQTGLPLLLLLPTTAPPSSAAGSQEAQRAGGSPEAKSRQRSEIATGELLLEPLSSAASSEQNQQQQPQQSHELFATSSSLMQSLSRPMASEGGSGGMGGPSESTASLLEPEQQQGEGQSVIARHGRSNQVSYSPPATSRLSAYSPGFSLQNSRSHNRQQSSSEGPQEQELAPSGGNQIGAIPLQIELHQQQQHLATTTTTTTRRPKPSGPFDPIIVCYLGSWSVYRPSMAKFTPENINPFLCTHIIYAFAGLSSKYELKPFDSYNDITQGGYRKFTSLKEHNKQLKTLIAVGGWNEGSAR